MKRSKPMLTLGVPRKAMLLLLTAVGMASCSQQTSQTIKATVDAFFEGAASSLSLNEPPHRVGYVLGAHAVYSTPDPNPNLDYEYRAQRKFDVKLENNNAGWGFVVTDEIGKIRVLDTKLNYAFTGDYTFDIRPGTSFFISNYDFDFDEIPELIVGSRSLGPKSSPASNNITLNVFSLEENEWVRVGEMEGNIIVSGNPRVFFVGNRVKIPRDIRGIVLNWAYESGKFVSVR